MRLHPAAGISMPRYVPPGGAIIDGHYYPGKTRVGVNTWVIHRNQEIFGVDVETFRPERWFEDNNKFMERNLYYVSFPIPDLLNRCSLARVVMFVLGRTYHSWRSTSFSAFLPHDELRLVNPDQELKHRCNFFVPQSGLKVYIERRP